MAQQVKVYTSANMDFSKYVEKSVNRLKMPKNIYVEGYLVALLSKFIEKEEGFLSDQPLMFRLLHSQGLEDYIKLGDETLFVTGFFPENVLKDKNKKYVISIGKESYICAAVKLDYEGEGHIYSVLSKDFERYSDVLHDVRYSMLEKIDDKEFFQLYKAWRDYNDKRALKKLKESGFSKA